MIKILNNGNLKLVNDFELTMLNVVSRDRTNIKPLNPIKNTSK